MERETRLFIDLKANKSKNANLIGKLEKELHVSPFWGMDHQYEWFFTNLMKIY